MSPLARFHSAQDRVYQDALLELQAGLGSSPTSQIYALSGLDEAKAYLADPREGLFVESLAVFYQGVGDPQTIALLAVRS